MSDKEKLERVRVLMNTFGVFGCEICRVCGGAMESTSSGPEGMTYRCSASIKEWSKAGHPWDGPSWQHHHDSMILVHEDGARSAFSQAYHWLKNVLEVAPQNG